MLYIRRLNMDSSWQLTWKETSILIDPWLLGTEIDGFSWFNEQWHVTPPLSIDALEDYQGILISQPFSDHCHEETLAKLEAVPFITSPKAKKRLMKGFPKRKMLELPTIQKNEWLNFGSLKIAYLKSSKVLSASFDGIVIRCKKEIVVYCPHGFELNEMQLKELKNYKVKALITGFSFFKLPIFLGGVVNPGKENALKLIEELQPEKIFHTHDEEKETKGLVKKIAQVNFLDAKEMEEGLKGKFTFLGADYQIHCVSE
jgi:hypothetical protein